MGLERVIDNIRNEGRTQADAIKADASRSADTIRADARRQADQIRLERAQAAEAAAAAYHKREVANAALEARRLRLSAERELLAALRSRVEERLRDLDEKTRQRHVESLVAQVGTQGAVWVAKQDEALAKAAGLTVAGTFEGLGGVIIESADGATRENLRYEMLLDETWTRALPKFASKLLA